MQSALGEGDREGNDFCANLEDRDKETEVLGGALLMLKNGADFLLGPMSVLFSAKKELTPIILGEKRTDTNNPSIILAVSGRWGEMVPVLLRV